jgi:ppGpp synthetase/RelA/SpoT-type nucleotidyltranferase
MQSGGEDSLNEGKHIQISPGNLEHARSPLWMVSRAPALNELVSYLEQARSVIVANPDGQHQLRFSKSKLKQARADFDSMIRRGEKDLHKLCELFCSSFLGQYQLQSLVIGEIPSTSERFTLTQFISSQDLYSTIDLDLGNRQLRKLQYFDGSNWVVPALVANMVEYQPTEPNQFEIHKIISRIKAEEELWNKVVDEIFQLDSLINQDKELRHLSPFVKDVFGIKIVVGATSDVLRLQRILESKEWEGRELETVGIDTSSSAANLEFLEVKNYINAHEKESGWEAMKSVVRWNEKTVEIQIQPLRNFWREREVLTRESHAGFKSRREEARNQVADHVPLFRFFRALLKALVQSSDAPIPEFSGVTVVVTE